MQNKKGSYSIIAVILMFISMLAITAYVDILSKTYVLNELQNIMDTTGLSVLQTAFDDKRLKEEMLALNGENYIDTERGTQILGNYEQQLYSRYIQSIEQSIRTNQSITYFQITSFDAFFERSTWGLGSTGLSRPQIGLDVIALVKIRTSSYFDTADVIEKYFYNAKSNNTFVITYQGTNQNGETELMIRSVVRLVYK